MMAGVFFRVRRLSSVEAPSWISHSKSVQLCPRIESRVFMRPAALLRVTVIIENSIF